MSYDFRLIKPRRGEDPHVTAQRDSEEFGTTPPDPLKEDLKRRIADALITHNPKLEIFQFGFDEIAKYENITVEQARVKYRHLELNGPEEDYSGIQILLFDDEASVSVPFWHEGDKAVAAFRELWSYLEIIRRETGYVIYDTQIERILATASDFDDALVHYTGVVGKIHETFPQGSSGRRPWWKFW
jgi:hypothetical protein